MLDVVKGLGEWFGVKEGGLQPSMQEDRKCKELGATAEGTA